MSLPPPHPGRHSSFSNCRDPPLGTACKRRIKSYTTQKEMTGTPLKLELNIISTLFYFNSHIWGERLLAHIMEPKWTKQWMVKIIRGLYSEDEYNKEMNALFVKLHLLDPQLVLPAFQFLLNQKGEITQY